MYVHVLESVDAYEAAWVNEDISRKVKQKTYKATLFPLPFFSPSSPRLSS